MTLRRRTPQRPLAYYLHRGMARMDPHRPLSRIHASDVTKDDWCRRRHALAQLLDVKLPAELISTASELVFFQGNQLATKVIMTAAQQGLAIGDWECFACGLLHTACKKPKVCDVEDCECKRFYYREMRVKDLDCGISCGLDLVLEYPTREPWELVEIKTYDKDKFKALRAPLAEHKDRTRLYLKAIDESHDPVLQRIDTSQARILYISKGGWGERSTKPKE